MKRHHSRKKNFVKIFAVVAVVAAALFGISAYLFKGKSDVVVATVNNQKIYKSEIDSKLRSVFDGQNFGGQASETKVPDASSLPKEVIEILAKEIYLDRELTKEAAKSKAAKSAELKIQIAQAKDRMIRQAYVNSVLKEKVSDEKVREKYAELSAELEGKKEYSLAHIVTKTKEEANKIAKELSAKKAPKFADLAKKYSIDQESAANGGNLGFIVEGNMFKEISDVLVTLKKDQVSQPIQTKFGWHLIKMSDVREAKALDFDAVKENIREQLSQEALNEINSKITKDAKIKILIKLQEPKAPESAAPEAAVDEKANAVAAPEAVEEVAAEEKTEEKVEEKAEEKTKEKTEEKSTKTKKDASKKQKDSKSKNTKK
ncbi:MAG: peptidylprolyl isomerase [Rickettsiales bacterium]|nr:peptidylprolyl isomerase [Rickettsiales bacterium]